MDCVLAALAQNTGAAINLGLGVGSSGNDPTHIKLIRCKYKFRNNAGKFTVAHAFIEMSECSIDTSITTIQYLVNVSGTVNSVLIAKGCDWTGVNIALVRNLPGTCNIRMDNCKIPAIPIMESALTDPAGIEVEICNTDSSATNYRNERLTGIGTLLTETTIVRTSGATNGTTPYSWRMASLANASFFNPMESLCLLS